MELKEILKKLDDAGADYRYDSQAVLVLDSGECDFDDFPVCQVCTDIMDSEGAFLVLAKEPEDEEGICEIKESFELTIFN